MLEDEITKILKDMEEQGFPLEVKTSEILEARGWEVINQFSYLDYETKKYRTVDAVELKNILESDKMVVDVNLVIECKKSANRPWVFYSSDFDLNNLETRRTVVSSTQFFINSLAYQKKAHEKLNRLMVDSFVLQSHFMSPIFGRLAYIPFEPFTGGKGRSIHKAQMQVCNAILDLSDHLFEEFSFELPYGVIFIPIIVLGGNLYSYKDKKLNPEEGLFYYITYGGFAFMVEIITEDFLDTYLSTIEEQIKSFQVK